MPNLQQIADALSGFGAGTQGQGGQFAESMARRAAYAQQEQDRIAQLDEKRKAAMVQDAWSVGNLLDQGKPEVALRLLDNRINNIQKLKGDPSDTIAIRDALVSGDPAQVAQARQELKLFSEAGIAAGAWTPPQESLESKKLAWEQDKFSQEQKFKQAELDWKKSRPAGEADGGQTAAERNMARYQQMINAGDPNAERFAYMVGLSGRDIESKIDLAGRQATAETTGKAGAERRDLFKTQGLAAAENLPTLNRALELQKQISTGGAASNIKGLQNYLGVASADVGELNSLFAQNILGQLKSTFGGNPTEGERAALEQAQSSFSQTGSINERLLQNALKLANERVSRGKRAAQADKDEGTLAEFDSLSNLSYGDKPSQNTGAKTTKVGRFQIEVH